MFTQVLSFLEHSAFPDGCAVAGQQVQATSRKLLQLHAAIASHCNIITRHS